MKRIVTICRALAVCLIALGSAHNTYAQQPVFKNYNVKDGLPSSETYFTFQDSKGFIWVASDAGVARFDGYSFKTYSIENGMVDNTVFGICEDRHGRIWFRSLSGKLCYWADDSIYNIGANDSIVANIKNSLMISFTVDSGDTLWCGIRAGNGYYKIYPGYKASDFHVITPSASSLYIIKTDENNFIYGNMLDHKYKKGLSIYNRKHYLGTPHFERLDPTNIHFLRQSADTFLVSDLISMCSFTAGNSTKLFEYGNEDNAMITCFSKEGDDLWISKRSKGIYNYIYNGANVSPGRIHYLNGCSVTNIMVDNEGGKWFTTLENGLYYLSPSHFVREYSLPQGPSSVRYMMNKIDGNRITISKSKDTIDIASADSIIRNVVINSSKCPDDILGHSAYTLPLIITTGNLYEFRGTSAYVIFSSNKKPMPVMDSAGYAIACYLTAVDTINKRIYAMNRYNLYGISEGSQYAKVLDTLPSRTLTSYVDDKGKLWLGCLNGLWAFENNKLKYKGGEYSYLKSRIKGICQDKQHVYYFSTFGNGVVVKKGNAYSRITIADGLISNNCEDVFVDGYGTIWVGAKSGISAVTLNEEGSYSVAKYNLSDAFPSQPISQILQSGNKLWLSTQNGIISHALPAIEVEPIPSVFITRFMVNDVKHSSDRASSLSYSENRIKISFVGLSYNSFGKMQYRYRLLGLDTAWHTTQTPNVDYQFLPAGQYDFSVKAIASNGKESKADIHLIFTINKPFWQTWWFISLLVLFVVSVFYYILKRVEKREHEKTLMNKRIADIEMKALRAQMNPHFIFNAINSIQNHILKNDSKTAQDYLARFARLIRNVLENSKLEDIPLGQEMDTLTLYIGLEQLRASGKFKFKIEIDPNVSVYNTLIPPLLLQPFVENSILHGLMPMESNTGMLTIHIYESDFKLICTIEDNGIGRKKAGEMKRHRNPTHRSMGISATEDRVNILNSFKPGLANISIEDKEGEETGTKVTITIPLKK